jgi:hypothetical protein
MSTSTPKINASPTKDFFISILVRDVLLYQAIADLVDNCVDGALRIRPDGNYNGLFVNVKFDGNAFSIEDNCGGISADVAINYAFRFGRPPGMPETPGSVGQFGVGMKRSLFKIGNYFSIASIAETSDFILDVDVEDWSSSVDENGKDKWEFEFTELHTDVTHDSSQWGTTITVTKLHESIASEFRTANFKLRLIDSLRAQHEESLAKGLVIEVNETTLSHDEAALLYSGDLKPLHNSKKVEFKDRPPVYIDILAGVVREADLALSGWYISCNGRLILKADKTKTTGWDDVYESITIPKPHYQFARFRGYVRFRCDDASLLPWNTTKSGLDTESPIYQSTRLDMIGAMRQILDFLNKLDAELDAGEDFLVETIKAARDVKIADIPHQANFMYPASRPFKAKPKVNRISYSRPAEEVDLAKELLGVSTLKEVGEGTFEYYLMMEGRNGG